ncbi:MAG: TolC family protein [Treponema sp.]|nr:TolC family protein [Treponema sp.]
MIRFSRVTWPARRTASLLVLIFVGIAWNVFGQDKPASDVMLLSPQDAVDLAIKNNLSLQTAKIDLDTKQRKADMVWNQFLPEVNVTGTVSRANWATTQQTLVPVPTSEIAPGTGVYDLVTPYSITLPNWNVIGTISASLNLSVAMIAGIQATRSNYQAGIMTFEKAKLQIERDIRKTYNQILLLENTVTLQNDAFDNAQRQANMAQANYEAGLVPRLTWLQAQVQVENLKPGMTDLENNLKALKANFAMTLGLPYDTEFNLVDVDVTDFQIPLDLADLISKASSGKPDIIELQKNIVALQNARKATAIQMYTPFLQLSWSISPMFNPTLDPWSNSWFEYDNWKGGGSFTAVLGFNLNSFLPFTKEGQSLKDMDSQITSLNINLAQLVQGTQLEIFTKVNSLENTQASAQVQKSAVDLAEMTYNLTEEAYRAGLQDFQSVQNSALALSQAKLQLLTQQFNYINDLIDLEYSVGVPFGTLSSF